MKKASIILAIAMFGAYAVDAACPNRCSGRGRCGADDKCACFPGFGGPDCSERNCKQGVAWIAGSEADPHSYAECSNRGTCDRVNGLCTCEEGFEGAACERSACPNDCSGHGQCEYIEELSSYSASNWAHHKIQGCMCDPGFEGEDCSKRMCPRGDDPLSIADSQDGDTWVLTFAYDTLPTTGEVAVQVTDQFGTTEISRPIAIDANSTTIKTNLEALRVLHSVQSVTEADTGSSITWTVVLSSPVRVNRVEAIANDCDDAGCFPLRTPLDHAVKVSAAMTVPADDNLESDVCGNRGRCDSSTGRCTCYEGYYGQACEKQTVLV